jgi:hypothetical protein
MNTLTYQCSEVNGLSFTLLVNGQPLVALVGGMDREIPFHLVDDGLPDASDVAVQNWVAAIPHFRGCEREIRLVAVCDCGEPGCGCTFCRVVRDGKTVAFCDFLGSGIAAVVEKEFRFSRRNYEAVLAEIQARAREFSAGCQNKRGG